jgi:uncharacterized damage-inducible protein DinB
MNVHEMLVEPLTYIAPARALEGLPAELAHRRVPNAAHTVAELVAHMAFWQDWFCRRCDGTRAPMVQRAADGWPDVNSRPWPEIERQFLDGLERAAAFGTPDRLDAPLSPPIEFPPLANYTVRDALTHMANHNAHHLGQVILLRQLLGTWPPPGGSWTW